MIYILILFAKIIEVSLRTIRVVLLVKGERRIAATIGFFEIIIWLVVVTNVIADLSSDPFKAIFYALGFALGNYFGSLIEEKIGIGLSAIEVNVKANEGKILADKLRAHGFGVTEIKAEGQVADRIILLLYVKRKIVNQVVYKITTMQKTAVITTSDIKPMHGGYGLKNNMNGDD